MYLNYIYRRFHAASVRPFNHLIIEESKIMIKRTLTQYDKIDCLIKNSGIRLPIWLPSLFSTNHKRKVYG